VKFVHLRNQTGILIEYVICVISTCLLIELFKTFVTSLEYKEQYNFLSLTRLFSSLAVMFRNCSITFFRKFSLSCCAPLVVITGKFEYFSSSVKISFKFRGMLGRIWEILNS